MKNDLHYYILCCGVLQASKKSEVKKIKTKLFQGMRKWEAIFRIVIGRHTYTQKKSGDKFRIVQKNVWEKVTEIERFCLFFADIFILIRMNTPCTTPYTHTYMWNVHDSNAREGGSERKLNVNEIPIGYYSNVGNESAGKVSKELK